VRNIASSVASSGHALHRLELRYDLRLTPKTRDTHIFCRVEKIEGQASFVHFYTRCSSEDCPTDQKIDTKWIGIYGCKALVGDRRLPIESHSVCNPSRRKYSKLGCKVWDCMGGSGGVLDKLWENLVDYLSYARGILLAIIAWIVWILRCMDLLDWGLQNGSRKRVVWPIYTSGFHINKSPIGWYDTQCQREPDLRKINSHILITVKKRRWSGKPAGLRHIAAQP
jgi:hypothetical protein